MSFVLSLILVMVFLACIAFLHREGMWNNAIRLVNVVVSALLATAGCNQAAEGLRIVIPSYVFLCHFLMIWGMFCLYYIVLRSVTSVLSRLQVRFLKLADRIGGAVFAALEGWVMVGFVLTTLHTAPLAEKFCGFQSGQPMFLGFLAPDQEWLGFVEKVTGGVYGGANVQGFSAREFTKFHRDRRAGLERHVNATGTLLIDPKVGPTPPAKDK